MPGLSALIICHETLDYYRINSEMGENMITRGMKLSEYRESGLYLERVQDFSRNKKLSFTIIFAAELTIMIKIVFLVSLP